MAALSIDRLSSNLARGEPPTISTTSENFMLIGQREGTLPDWDAVLRKADFHSSFRCRIVELNRPNALDWLTATRTDIFRLWTIIRIELVHGRGVVRPTLIKLGTVRATDNQHHLRKIHVDRTTRRYLAEQGRRSAQSWFSFLASFMRPESLEVVCRGCRSTHRQQTWHGHRFYWSAPNVLACIWVYYKKVYQHSSRLWTIK